PDSPNQPDAGVNTQVCRKLTTFSEATMAKAKTPRNYTSKQMGDACEMLVAGEVTLAGVPAFKMPDNWPHYDVIAQPKVGVPQRIYARSRTFKRGGDTFVDF